MRRVRELTVAVGTLLAILAGVVALGTWWSAKVVHGDAPRLSPVSEARAVRSVEADIRRHDPAILLQPGAGQAILSALSGRRVLDELLLSAEAGSRAFRTRLTRLDPKAGRAVGATTLHVSVTRPGALRARLRQAAGWAWKVAAGCAVLALALASLRHLVLRRLALAAGIVGGLAVALTWGLPNLVTRFAHRGGLADAARRVLADGAPVRWLLVWCLVAGTAAYLVALVFELSVSREKVVYLRAARSRATVR